MGKSLMIVDDSATMRKIIMRTVRMSGLEFERTEEAGSGTEAMQKLTAGPVDVVLCDINMPEMNGTEMVKRPANCRTARARRLSWSRRKAPRS